MVHLHRTFSVWFVRTTTTTNHHNKTVTSIEFSISHIKQQQQRILTSLQQQQQQQQQQRIPLGPSTSLGLTHIQRIDASYQMMNAIYIRITIATTTANSTPSATSRTTATNTNNDRQTTNHNEDTDTHLQQEQMLLLSVLKEQYQPKIPYYYHRHHKMIYPNGRDCDEQIADGEGCHLQCHNHHHFSLLVPIKPVTDRLPITQR